MELKLIVDEKDIKINSFVQEFLAGTIIGALNTLNGIDTNSTSIVIKIEK